MITIKNTSEQARIVAAKIVEPGHVVKVNSGVWLQVQEQYPGDFEVVGGASKPVTEGEIPDGQSGEANQSAAGASKSGQRSTKRRASKTSDSGSG